MRGVKAKQARRFFNAFLEGTPGGPWHSSEIERQNVREKEVTIDALRGLVLTYTTSTHFIPRRNLYQTVKRMAMRGRGLPNV